MRKARSLVASPAYKQKPGAGPGLVASRAENLFPMTALVMPASVAVFPAIGNPVPTVMLADPVAVTPMVAVTIVVIVTGRPHVADAGAGDHLFGRRRRRHVDVKVDARA